MSVRRSIRQSRAVIASKRPELELRLVNEGFKGHSYRKNTLSELKAVLEMTTARPDTS